MNRPARPTSGLPQTGSFPVVILTAGAQSVAVAEKVGGRDQEKTNADTDENRGEDRLVRRWRRPRSEIGSTAAAQPASTTYASWMLIEDRE